MKTACKKCKTSNVNLLNTITNEVECVKCSSVIVASDNIKKYLINSNLTCSVAPKPRKKEPIAIKPLGSAPADNTDELIYAVENLLDNT